MKTTLKTQADELLELVKTDVLPDSHKSVLVFIKEDTKWLMVRNKFRSWEFPGGHKEGNEDVFETAKREAFEEAGVEIKNLKYVGYYRLQSGHTTLVVLAEVERLHDIPEEFETEERLFVSSLPLLLSFNDAVYPWLIKNFI
jgi:8-oxo-dGTP diphosphatase